MMPKAAAILFFTGAAAGALGAGLGMSATKERASSECLSQSTTCLRNADECLRALNDFFEHARQKELRSTP